MIASRRRPGRAWPQPGAGCDRSRWQRRPGYDVDLRWNGSEGGSVTFDLYVWHEPTPMRAEVAAGKVARWFTGGTGVFV
jgi:hypothetical protein